MKRLCTALGLAAFCFLAAPSAQAGSWNTWNNGISAHASWSGWFHVLLSHLGFGGHFHHTGGGGGGGGSSHAAPGPEAGIGVPVLLTVGGYIWLTRRSRRNRASKSKT